jgi:hypothetical protein
MDANLQAVLELRHREQVGLLRRRIVSPSDCKRVLQTGMVARHRHLRGHAQTIEAIDLMYIDLVAHILHARPTVMHMARCCIPIAAPREGRARSQLLQSVASC